MSLVGNKFITSYSIILFLLHLLVTFFNFSILMFGLPAIYKYSTSLFTFYNWEIFPYITPCVYAIGLNAQTTSAYLTLCVTLERYVAVCRPLKVWLIKSSMFCKYLKYFDLHDIYGRKYKI